MSQALLKVSEKKTSWADCQLNVVPEKDELQPWDIDTNSNPEIEDEPKSPSWKRGKNQKKQSRKTNDTDSGSSGSTGSGLETPSEDHSKSSLTTPISKQFLNPYNGLNSPTYRHGTISNPTHYNGGKFFVGGLPRTSTKEDLLEYFCQFGNIIDCVVMFDKDNRHRGFGFVTFSNSVEKDRVMLVYDQHYIKHKWVEVKQCIPKDDMLLMKQAGATQTNQTPKNKGNTTRSSGKTDMEGRTSQSLSPNGKQRSTISLDSPGRGKGGREENSNDVARNASRLFGKGLSEECKGGLGGMQDMNNLMKNNPMAYYMDPSLTGHYPQGFEMYDQFTRGSKNLSINPDMPSCPISPHNMGTMSHPMSPVTGVPPLMLPQHNGMMPGIHHGMVSPMAMNEPMIPMPPGSYMGSPVGAQTMLPEFHSGGEFGDSPREM